MGKYKSVVIEGFTGDPVKKYPGMGKILLAGIPLIGEFVVDPESTEQMIIGIDLLTRYNLWFDPYTMKIYQKESGNGKVFAFKVKSIEQKEKWEQLVPGVGVESKYSCGKHVTAQVEILGPMVAPQKQYPISKEAEDGILEVIQELEKEGVVKKTVSPFNSPVWPVRKADGKTWRLVVDYRNVNRQTPAMAPIVANIVETIHRVGAQAHWFSVIDLANCYFAFPLTEDSQQRFAFTLRGQQYTFTRVPQGFHNAPAIAHKHVKEMMNTLDPEDQACSLSYVDDILIWGKTEQEVYQRTIRVLEKIRDTGFKVNLEKAQLVKEKVRYLGITLEKGGRVIEPQRIEQLCGIQEPKDIKELRMLLGAFGFVRSHIPDYAELTKPMYHLLKKGVEWNWTELHSKNLEKLKLWTRRSIKLFQPDNKKPFYVRPYWSQETISAGLYQRQDGNFRPVAYASRNLTSPEKKYTECEKAALTVMWALQTWEYIIGTTSVIVQSPHGVLKYILQGKAPTLSTVRLAQWTVWLAQKGVTSETVKNLEMFGPILKEQQVTHECGDENAEIPQLKGDIHNLDPDDYVWFTDGGSWFQNGERKTAYAAYNIKTKEVLREFISGGYGAQGAELQAVLAVLRKEKEQGRSVPIHIVMDSEYVYKGVTEFMYFWARDNWKNALEKDLKHKEEWMEIKELVDELREGLTVYWIRAHQTKTVDWKNDMNNYVDSLVRNEEEYKKIARMKERNEQEQLIMDLHNIGHEGVEKIWERSRPYGNWKGKRKLIKHIVENCLYCAQEKREYGPSNQIILPQREKEPWSIIYVDYIDKLPRTREGYQYLLVVIDGFSRWVEAFPTKRNDAGVTAKRLYEVFTRMGVPSVISSDRGGAFIGETVKQMEDALGIKRKLHISYRPQSSGKVERVNQTIKGMLRKMVKENGKDWNQHLPTILAALRSSPLGPGGYSPYEILFGAPMHLGFPHEFVDIEDEWRSILNQREEQRQWVREEWERQNQVKNQIESDQVMIPIGEQVGYLHLGTKEHCLRPRWKGPFVVLDTIYPVSYLIEINGKQKWVHRNQIKPWTVQE